MPNIGRKINPPQLPDIPADLDPVLRDILEAYRQGMDLREGRLSPNTNSRFVTIQDLVDAGIVADGVIT